MQSARESLLLNAMSSMTMTSFSKQICEEAEYDSSVALNGVDVFISGLKKGLEEHSNLLKLETNDPSIPSFISSFFKKESEKITKDVDESLKDVCLLIENNLKNSVKTMCFIHDVVKNMKENNSKPIVSDKDKVLDGSEKLKSETSFGTNRYDYLFEFKNPILEKINPNEGLCDIAGKYARYIESVAPDCHERTLSIIKVKEALMWANVALKISNT